MSGPLCGARTFLEKPRFTASSRTGNDFHITIESAVNQFLQINVSLDIFHIRIISYSHSEFIANLQ